MSRKPDVSVVFEQAVTREVGEEYATDPVRIELRGVRNVLRRDSPEHHHGQQTIRLGWSNG